MEPLWPGSSVLPSLPPPLQHLPLPLVPALSAIRIPGGDEDRPVHRPVQQGLHGLHECVQHLNVAMETLLHPWPCFLPCR
ncbi:unnamed protein product, partial [Rangifer tarandus platyrhynchus]